MTPGDPTPPFFCVSCRDWIYFESPVKRDGDDLCARCDVMRDQLDLFPGLELMKGGDDMHQL